MQCFLFVADLHAITVWQEPAQLAAQTREIAAAYLAAGARSRARRSSSRSRRCAAHAELAWIFNCVARLGWLDRMTQFKEKAGKHKERASVGLYTYPVLQAADILVYKATHVPVGEDQKQHLELTRDIAQKFNHDFGAPGFFPLTEPLIEGPGARVMSLRDGTAEDVEVRPVRPFAHQPDRRRRHHRPEDPQGQDRRRAAAGDASRGWRAGPRRTTWSASTRALAGQIEGRGAGALRRPGLRRVQAGAGGTCGRGDESCGRPLPPLHGRAGSSSTASSPRGRRRPRPWPSRSWTRPSASWGSGGRSDETGSRRFWRRFAAALAVASAAQAHTAARSGRATPGSRCRRTA